MTKDAAWWEVLKNCTAGGILKTLLGVLPVVAVGLQWLTDPVSPGNLQMEVPKVSLQPWLETPYLYFYLHAFTLIPVLLLSFDQNVHYFRKWKFLLPAILPVAAIFIIWDVFFTVRGVWGFNDKYLTGVQFLQLPVEEWLFFFTVPFACVFIYECLNFYIRRDLLASVERWLTPLLVVFFLSTGSFFWSHMYTATTFLLAGGFLLFHYLFLDGSYRSRFYLAYLGSWGPFLIVNGVLTGGYTLEPVVVYNPEEFLGIRITSVPLDDSVYSFLLFLGTVTIFEALRKNRA